MLLKNLLCHLLPDSRHVILYVMSNENLITMSCLSLRNCYVILHTVLFLCRVCVHSAETCACFDRKRVIIIVTNLLVDITSIITVAQLHPKVYEPK